MKATIPNTEGAFKARVAEEVFLRMSKLKIDAFHPDAADLAFSTLKEFCDRIGDSVLNIHPMLYAEFIGGYLAGRCQGEEINGTHSKQV